MLNAEVLHIIYSLAIDGRALALTCRHMYNAFIKHEDHIFWQYLYNPLDGKTSILSYGPVKLLSLIDEVREDDLRHVVINLEMTAAIVAQREHTQRYILWWALKFGTIEVIKYLVELVDKIWYDDMFVRACEVSTQDIVCYLFERNIVCVSSMLRYIITYDRYDMMVRLNICKFEDIEDFMETVCYMGSYKILCGVLADRPSINYEHLLRIAVKEGYVNIVKRLVDIGADPSVISQNLLKRLIYNRPIVSTIRYLISVDKDRIVAIINTIDIDHMVSIIFSNQMLKLILSYHRCKVIYTATFDYLETVGKTKRIRMLTSLGYKVI